MNMDITEKKMPINLSRCILLLCFISLHIISTFSQKRCLVCKKNIDKKADRKTPQSAEVLLQCFGVTYSQDSAAQPLFMF